MFVTYQSLHIHLPIIQVQYVQDFWPHFGYFSPLVGMKILHLFPSLSVAPIGMHLHHYKLMRPPDPHYIGVCPLLFKLNQWVINPEVQIGTSCCIIPYKVSHQQVYIHLWQSKKETPLLVSKQSFKCLWCLGDNVIGCCGHLQCDSIGNINWRASCKWIFWVTHFHPSTSFVSPYNPLSPRHSQYP